MREEILKTMNQNNYRSSDSFELSKKMKLSSKEDFQRFSKALDDLMKDGTLSKNKNGKYNLSERFGFLKGTLDLKQAGYGFVKLDEAGRPDVFIPRNLTSDAMRGDYCLVKITKENGKDRYEGEIIRVLKRSLDIIIGEYYQGAVFPKNNPSDIIFKVRKDKNTKYADHSLVKAKVVKYSKFQILEVVIEEVLGDMSEPGIDILEVIARNDIVVEFPKEVLEEVKLIQPTIDKEPMTDRIDLRKKLIITIDGDDTKDIDDAISIEKLNSKEFLLGVHIADVSYYVKKGSPLDQEAFSRGTSVYLADRVVPMLPKELSNGICSLNPQVDRFAISCEMKINYRGEVIAYYIYPSIIQSRHQMTYKNVNAMIDGNTEVISKYTDLVESVSTMKELAKILHDTRTQEGSINFETIEPKIVFGEHGEVKNIVIRDRGISENIIEEFMLVANQVIASHMVHLELPFIYRIHENPDPAKLESLFVLAKELAYIANIPDQITHQDLQKLLQKIEDTKYEKVINMLMLRSMAKAKYSEDNVGHYGLAFENYTHFTSPIRRYPDLIVHRYLRDYLFLKILDQRSIHEKEEELPEIAAQSSKQERTATIAEREVMDMKKAEYMEPFIGDTFEGVVSTLTRFGMFVELPNTVEGLVHISTFSEAIEFIEEKMMYLGISSRIEYTIGKVVKVKCVNVSKLLGRVDFELV
ncbi:MAG: ribonuclease R [Firmicutes bacterium]|nr:ribonuclease R [Bacillota bacterium]